MPLHRTASIAVATFLLSGLLTGPLCGQTKPAVETSAKPMATDEAKELFRSVDEILKFVSNDSHLEIKGEVKRKLMTRDEVNRFLKKKFEEDESAKRMERDEIVLKKFGLLDRDFHLQPFLIKVLTEQIAGFYDPKTKTVNLLNWVSPDQQKPVLAHELTHALQDMRVGLEKWSNPLADSISKTVADDNRHIAADEMNTARDAVAEGQAMVTFIDYALRPTGKTLATSPELIDKLTDTGAGATGDSTVLATAPLLLQQTLMFPYTSGVKFEAEVQRQTNADTAFAGVLDHPPTSSHEILHPQDYVDHVSVSVLAMPDVHPLLDKDWEPYDIGVMGELDVRITAELFGDREIAAALAPVWDGGIYYAAQKRNVTAVEKQNTSSIGLMYFSRWKDTDSARSFLHVYSTQLGRKYSKLSRVTGGDEDHQLYQTNEGDVVLSLDDRTVFISEGFDRATAAKLNESMRAAQGSGPIRSAALTSPTEDLTHTIASFGVMRAGLNAIR